MSFLSPLIRALSRSVFVLIGIGSAEAATRFEHDADFNLPVFTRPVRGSIDALPLSDGGALASGGFVASDGVSQGRLIRLDAQGTVVVANFADGLRAPGGWNDALVAVQLRDDRVLLALPSATHHAPAEGRCGSGGNG